jgi:uncharacterized ferritin-like protein (DUF455 family)
MPKRGKAGSLKNRITLLHSLAHIESYAIDLSWDIIARFYSTKVGSEDQNAEFGEPLPTEFFDDWVRIAGEEASHFNIWAARLKFLGSHYGALPGHDGLWESASSTADTLLARLSIVHCVHEARGLDVAPTTLARLRAAGDEDSAALLEGIFEQEITHVAAGVRWIKYLCEKNHIEPIPAFHAIVRERFRGNLKPPFNTEARARAGFTEEWYGPLAAVSDTKDEPEEE